MKIKAGKGFTLLELLFVIAIIATMATFGLNTYRQRVVNNRVTKAALEMQQILQAANAYHADKGVWPVDDVAFQPYLPFPTDTKDPWGHAYNYAPEGNQEDARLYEVSTGIDPLALPVSLPSCEIAQRLAAKLPGGEAVCADDKYRATIKISASDFSNQGKFRLIDVGVLKNVKTSGLKNIKPCDCPVGAEPVVVVSSILPFCDACPQGSGKVSEKDIPLLLSPRVAVQGCQFSINAQVYDQDKKRIVLDFGSYFHFDVHYTLYCCQPQSTGDKCEIRRTDWGNL